MYHMMVISSDIESYLKHDCNQQMITYNGDTMGYGDMMDYVD